MDINAIRSLVTADLEATDQLIKNRLHSDIALINELSFYIINSGGKRLRPLSLLLSANCFNYQGEHHRLLAAVIEFIHTATLIHDDIVDESDMRRGKQTANEIWGNASSVLVGDFLYSRSFQMMVTTDNMRVLKILADTTNTIAEGEILQLLNCGNPETSEHDYLQTIHHKTAILFAAATQLGAVIADAGEQNIQAMADYGLNLGMAFQLTDDILDYTASSDDLGKNIGDDLAEGKPTLPLIYAMQQGDSKQQMIIKQAIEHGNIENLEKIQTAIHETKAIDYSYQVTEKYIAKAVQALTAIADSEYKAALNSLTTLIKQRKN